MLDLSRTDCLGAALRDAVIMYKTNTALLEAQRLRESGRYSYRELAAQAERLTALLQESGFEPGDRCAILMSNQARWVISAFGALWAGAVLVPIDYKLTAAEQVALLRHAKPKALITEYGIWRSLEGLEGVRVLVSEPPSGAQLGAASDWAASARRPFRYVPRQRDDLACVVYSSGTGGTPKGCMLTHDCYLLQAEVIGRLFPMTESDVYFSVLPTNHAIDFMGGVIVPFLFGAAVAHQRTLRPEFLSPTMQRFGVTHTALVPRILKNLRDRIEEQLAELPEWQQTAIRALTQVNDLATMREPKPWLSRSLLKPIHDRFGGKLRLIIAGGAFVDPELASYFYRLGLPVAIGYGLTEAGVVLSCNDLKPFRPDTVGKPVPGVELVIHEPDAQGIGEVRVRSRTVMRGYFEAESLTAESMSRGWLKTGDLGYLDASGHLKLLGRAKNMIVTEGGKNVYPEDIEAAFETVPCEDLCVFAERYLWPKLELRGEGLCAVLRLKPGQQLSAALEALRAANHKLADYKRVRSYLLAGEEFPKTASLKVKRQQLAAALRVQAARPEPLSEST
ncbi:MAG TPA: AMP-binding protein, partial [Polyangiales bacterium]|nr:AMP-binding protein [Polyangiales bacterium]